MTNLGSTLGSLRLYPNDSTIQKFCNVCEHQLNVSDETDGDDSQKKYIKVTDRDAVVIAVAKLVASDVIPTEYLASEIISHFVMHGTGIAMTVKNLIAALKKKDDGIANILLGALKKAYCRYEAEVSQSNDKALAAKLFQEFKDLAARLSETYS